MPKSVKVSIIIPTLGRSESLKTCLDSIHVQSYKNFEIITVTEEGPLSKIRNLGASRASGEIITFTDDDVVCDRRWLESIVRTFESLHVSGVSGPCTIPYRFKQNRDLFRHKLIKRFYDLFFVGRIKSFPGHIASSGAWSTAACDENCSYEGSVQFLEACNMSFKADIFRSVGGFDESYGGVGDWSEPDLAFKIRTKGNILWFCEDAKLEHHPSRSGAFSKRRDQAMIRMQNYELFSKRWIKPCIKHSLYKLFMRAYYATSSIG